MFLWMTALRELIYAYEKDQRTSINCCMIGHWDLFVNYIQEKANSMFQAQILDSIYQYFDLSTTHAYTEKY